MPSSRPTTCVARCLTSSPPMVPRRSAVPSPASLPARARPQWSWVTTCAPKARSSPGPSVTACSSTASTSSTSGCAQPTCCTTRRVCWTCRAPSSPHRTTRPDTTASRCVSAARPRSLATPASTPSRQWRSQAQIRRAAPVPAPSSTCCRAMSTMSARSSTCRR